MIYDLAPLELENISAVESVEPRMTIDHERIFEPLEIGLLPRKLKLEMRDGEIRNVGCNDEMNFKSSSVAPIKCSAFHNSTGQINAQAIGRDVPALAVILRNRDRAPCRPNSACDGQIID